MHNNYISRTMTHVIFDENNKSGLKSEDFKATVQDKETSLYILKNPLGMEVAVTNYGCAVLSIMVPDKNGEYANVVQSHDSIDHVINSPEPFLGTTIGRYGNRIAKGQFTLGLADFQLATNNKAYTLHGGPAGFHTRVWDVTKVSASKITFQYVSADGEEGFPGTLTVTMSYELADTHNGLYITYKATTDQPTMVNLTNHGFFNLRGVGNPTPSILDHVVTINADFYLPIDKDSIPTGEILKVEGTPMDFRTPHTVGERIDEPFEQLKNGTGYDHCYVLNKNEFEEFAEAAVCVDPVSGRRMTVFTTEPGVQLYTGNWLNGFEGAHGATFPARSAICFEAQHFPDTPNKPHFPTTRLNPKEKYNQVTAYVFDVVD